VTSAVLHVRLFEPDDASTSITRQEADLRARAAREEWDVVVVLTDDGLSGGKRRPRLTAHLPCSRRVRRTSPWSRSLTVGADKGLAALANLVDVLEKRPGARFIADRDGLDSSGDTWEMHAGMMSAVAKLERKNIQTRVASIAELRRTGRYAGGTVPYGYRSAHLIPAALAASLWWTPGGRCNARRRRDAAGGAAPRLGLRDVAPSPRARPCGRCQGRATPAAPPLPAAVGHRDVCLLPIAALRQARRRRPHGLRLLSSFTRSAVP
jgi:DNA invertase Pin-like site-specific DNA recombinase